MQCMALGVVDSVHQLAFASARILVWSLAHERQGDAWLHGSMYKNQYYVEICVAAVEKYLCFANSLRVCMV